RASHPHLHQRGLELLGEIDHVVVEARDVGGRLGIAAFRPQRARRVRRLGRGGTGQYRAKHERHEDLVEVPRHLPLLRVAGIGRAGSNENYFRVYPGGPSMASKVESRLVMPVPPVRMNASTEGAAQPERITAVTWAGSSFTMAWPATRWPAAVRSSRMSFPLVSVSGVFESDMVSTKQPTDT